MATRIGVDVGGTFTDLIFYDDNSGEIRVSKEPTTPTAPEQGVLAAITTAVP
jgi:N-methylhydantoinase A